MPPPARSSVSAVRSTSIGRTWLTGSTSWLPITSHLAPGACCHHRWLVHLHVAVDADVAQVDDRVAGADQLVPGVHHRLVHLVRRLERPIQGRYRPMSPRCRRGNRNTPQAGPRRPANQVSPSRPTTLIGLPRRPIERIHVRSGRRSRSRSRTGARSGATKRLRTASRRGRFTASRAEVPIRWTIRGKILRPGGCVPNALPNLWRSHWSAAAV